MADFNPNVWAPWRMEYIRSIDEEARNVGCFLCHYWQNPQEDHANHVVLRGQSVFAVLNRFPYTNGHLLIAPANHVDELGGLDQQTLVELTTTTRDALAVISEAIGPQGFNIGYNIGRCAGAGLPDHIHGHIVPRWDADTNYMAVLGGIRVIPDALEATYGQLIQAAERLGLRDGRAG
jgi:ATP adenylyltransferase